MIFQNLLSTSFLLLLASQLAPTSANPVPEDVTRRSFYNDATFALLKDHRNYAREQAASGYGESAKKENVKRDLVPSRFVKRDLAWNPSRLWGLVLLADGATSPTTTKLNAILNRVENIVTYVLAVWKVVERPPSHTTNNATYKNHKVRTIYDCLLNRTAIEYGDNVAAFGFKPVQYILDDIKYYRFYDNNNFAWFTACPST
ncbi:uncharacterized protein DFL_004529 [Arthrobotrys flagrans]|uniref:Uncharacterized protein n=1 Tax=Arthrobotrys flagrans TaxID=97331 RepID=A0A437A4W7_ARTFL|nr:hypothetical protein DFL_004529 [Arthrobotrys flagrans]